MRILVCNERFLFRFGVDRCLLMLGDRWRRDGHEVILMGNKLDQKSVSKCSDRFIQVPEAPEYAKGNDYTLTYLQDHWDDWFDAGNKPDVALVAGWPFYRCLGFLREKCGCVVFNDYGAVPLEGMSGGALVIQKELRRLRKENLPQASKIIAISHFLEDTQSKPDTKGTVPTTVVHLGVDHIAGRLWAGDELSLEENSVVEQVKALKEQGIRIIFQPGRWENGNYKNSAGSTEIIRALNKKRIDHRILVLSDEASLETVPADIRGHYFCLGFVDDETMKKLMELSDVGISPTRWEGFDLPLGEMQYLGKPMFVLNVGAHPEVAADPYFLCKNMREMASKVISTLNGKMPFAEGEFERLCAGYREIFTWDRCAEQMAEEMHQAIFAETVLFIDVTNACHDPANSGVMRVTRKLSRHLQERMNTVFVLWDDSIGQFVLPYRQEITQLSAYDGPESRKITFRSEEGQARRKMEDILPELGAARMACLFIETVRYGILASAIPWLHEHGIAVSAVFHDAIPVLHPEYCSKEVAENHQQYMNWLAEMDSVIPTAEHNGEDLKDNWQAQGIQSETDVHAIGLAAEIDGLARNRKAVTAVPAEKRILFVSTLEPRKNHILFLQAVEELFEKHPDIGKKTSIHLVGNRYAGNEEIPAFVEKFCAGHDNVKWLGVVDDQTLKAEYGACTFTAYPSVIEGFGMPIIESLWAGKPCLCSNEGSIADLAAAGGCCTVNVKDKTAMADALYRMLTDDEYLLNLQHQAVERPIRSWTEYADEVAAHLSGLARTGESRTYRRIPAAAVQAIEEEFSGCTCRRMITAGNFYPPVVIGGAEIIAHKQLKTLREEGLARGIAFSLDTSGKNAQGAVTSESYEGVTVVRVSVDPRSMDQDRINFFNPVVNDVFRELCAIVRPDVVHMHNVIGMSLGMVDVAREYGAKTVFTLHDNWGFCYKNTMLDNQGKLCGNVFDCAKCRETFGSDGARIPIGVRKSYFRRIFEKTDAFVSPSEYLAGSYIRAGFDAHKMHVLWNGIDCSAYAVVKNKPDEAVRITYAGYFGSHKGVDTLIRAIALLKDRNIVLNLVGDGAEEQNYRSLASKLGIGGRLCFRGRVSNDEISRIYQETDIYCLPSVWPENQPVSITEAMASGIPVIASNLGGSKELVVDGVTGYLAEAGNAEDLAEKISLLYDDPEKRRAMGEAGRQRMAENDYSRQVGKLAELYDRIIPVDTVKSRRMLLVKGSIIPEYMDKSTRYDVIPWAWILDDNDLKQAEAIVLLPGETLSLHEAELADKYHLPVFVQKEKAEDLRTSGRNVVTYTEEDDLLQAVAII